MRRQIVTGAVVAGLMLLAAWGQLQLQALGLLPGGREELYGRTVNIIAGLMIVWLANRSPKMLKPLAETRCDPAREQAGRRFSSPVIMIAGLLYTLVWLVAPTGLALPVAAGTIAAAVLVVIARCLFVRAKPTPAAQ
jgi:hypothetical protein